MVEINRTNFDLIIEGKQSNIEYFSEVWQYRDLFFFLAWRDFQVRYSQTIIGSAWAVVRPLFTMIVFTVIFGNIAKMPSEGVPYPILVFVGLLPWQLFSAIFSMGTSSLIANSHLLTKVYFPRLIIVFAGVLVSLIDFFITLIFLFFIMAWYRYFPTGSIIFAPIFLFVTVLSSLGAAIWLAALSVRYRDFIQVAPFLQQMLQYVSPVGFSSSVVPVSWRFFYSLNPMVGVIDGFRWAFLGTQTAIYLPGILVSVFLTLLVLVSGIWYFRRVEKTFVDLI